MSELNDKLITYGNLSTFYDKLQEQGLGGNAIEEVSELPNASENKDKLFRLDNGDKDVYAAKLLSSETTTTNRLPDEQQINKAYLYNAEALEVDVNSYYYNGEWSLLLNDGEISGYGWLGLNNMRWYLIICEDIISNTTLNTRCINITFEDGASDIDFENHIVTMDDVIENWEFADGVDLSYFDITAIIPAIYNAPESAQIGNATIVDGYAGDTYYYNGTSVTLVDYDGTTVEGYEWVCGIDKIVSTHKASEIFYYHDNDNVYLGDTIFYNVKDAADFWSYDSSTNTYTNIDDSFSALSYCNMNTGEGFNEIDALYIPQLNAPDSEQVDNAYLVEDYMGGWTCKYTGEETTIEVNGSDITVYIWLYNEWPNVPFYSTKRASEIYNTHNDSSDVKFYVQEAVDLIAEISFEEGSLLSISTVKYQRTEVTEEWGWRDIIPTYASDSDIDDLFAPPTGNIITLIRYQDAEQQAEGFVDMWVNTSGETMEYDGQTYYKWVSWANDGSEGAEPAVEKPNYVMLTNTLDITLPFNIDSPEYEYTITYDSEGDTWSDAEYFHGDYTQKTVQ